MRRLTGRHPLRRIQALHLLCSFLAEPAEPPTCTDAQLADVTVIAAEERISAALCLVLDRAGALDRLDAEVARSMQWSRRQTMLTQRRFERQLINTLTALQAASIPAIVTKGAALLLDVPSRPLTPRDRQLVAARSMSDLDVLVPADAYEPALDVLRQRGYRKMRVLDHEELESDHAATMAAPGEPGPVDLHRVVGAGALSELLPVDEVFARGVPATIGTAHCQVLGPVDAMVHSVWHAQMSDSNYRYRILPTRQLHSFALLFRWLDGATHWDGVRARYQATGYGAVLDAHSEQLASLFGIETGRLSDRRRARRQLRACVASFAAAGLADARRNMAGAFAPAYMQILYGDQPLATARARHALTLLTHDRRTVAAKAFHAEGR